MPGIDSSRHSRQVSVTRINKGKGSEEKQIRRVVAVKRREKTALPAETPTPIAVAQPENTKKRAVGFAPPSDKPKEDVSLTEEKHREPEKKLPESRGENNTERAGAVQDSSPKDVTEKVSVSQQRPEKPTEETAADEKSEVNIASVTETEPEAISAAPVQAAPPEELKETQVGTVKDEQKETDLPEEAPTVSTDEDNVNPDVSPKELVLQTTQEGTVPEEFFDQPDELSDETEVREPWFRWPSLNKDAWYVPQKWSDINLLRKIIMIASVGLILFSCLPLVVGILSPGILPPVCIALFFFFCALYWPRIEGCESVRGNVLIAVVAVCVLAGVSYLSFVSGKMISASANTLRDDTSQVTVVVLGCRVKGDKPSLMLTARLEKAAEFLLEHPQAHCIVTGGQGPDEDYPEALVMKNYLVDKGVSSMRIIMENTSTSTLENITNASELAGRYNCHDRFLIVTDRFHQYRAMSIAKNLGIVTYALNVETAWYLAMPYWFREIAAITRDWVVA